VENGLEALKAVEKQEFDVIFMDVMYDLSSSLFSINLRAIH